MSDTQTHHVPAGTPASVTVGPDRLSRVAEGVAIVRDVLLIAFMVTALVFGVRLVSAVSTLGTPTPADPAQWEVPYDAPTGCVGEVPC